MTTLDAELLNRACDHDAGALAEIYDRHATTVYRYLYRYLGDAAQAEDLTSEVFLKLLEALGTRRAPRDHLQGWLYRVAHNLAMDSFRQQTRNSTAPLAEEIPTDDDPPWTTIDKNQTRDNLRAALRQLTRDQQQVILLRFSESLKVAEVSQVMGKSEGAVKILQHRAVRRLRKLLDRQE